MIIDNNGFHYRITYYNKTVEFEGDPTIKMDEDWDAEYEESDDHDIDWWGSDVDDCGIEEEYRDFTLSNCSPSKRLYSLFVFSFFLIIFRLKIHRISYEKWLQ